MLLFQKLTYRLTEQKLSCFLLLILIFIGFLSGCFCIHLISDTEFFNAGVQAEEFIRAAKNKELNFYLIFQEEFSPYLLIGLCSLFLPGFIFVCFLVFKWGFSLGFFLTFLVKYFFLKGFFLGGVFLLLNLIFFFAPLIFLANQSLSLNHYLIRCALRKTPSKQTLVSEFFYTAIATLLAALAVMLGVASEVWLLTPLCNYLFL